jgi:hypothetical protein
VPADDQLPDLPAGAVPEGLHDDDFDLWALFETEQDGHPGVLGAPPLEGIHRALEMLKESRAARRAAFAARPDPLREVLAALADPGAPEDWVSAETLAGVLGRYSPDDDEATRRRATEALGGELRRQTGLKAKQRRTGGDRQRGYDIAALREAADRLASGET